MKNLLKTFAVLLAVAVSFQARAADQDITEGKIQASTLTQALELQTESEDLIANIVMIEDMVGTSMDDSDGLLKALGEKEFFASLAKKDLDTAIGAMKKATSETELSNGYKIVLNSAHAIQRLNQEAKRLVK